MDITNDENPKGPGGRKDGNIGPAAGGRIAAASDSSLDGDVDPLLSMQVTQMKARIMHNFENEIDGIIGNKMHTLNAGTAKETFKDDIEKQGSKRTSSRKKLSLHQLCYKSDNIIIGSEHSTTNGNISTTDDHVRKMQERIDRLQKEHALSKIEHERTIEELRSLVASSHPDHQTDPNESGTQRSVNGIQKVRATMLKRVPTLLKGSELEISLDEDTFSLMMISPVRSPSWILGFTSFTFQITFGTMIAYGQFAESKDSSIFGVPFRVEEPTVRVAQFLCLILFLSCQNDILSSIHYFFLLGKGSNWCHIIGEGKARSSFSLWVIRVGVPNTLKLTQGIVVTFVSFVIIVQNKNTIDLLKDFTSLMIISEFDNILFQLAAYGYLGEELRLQTCRIEDGAATADLSSITPRQRLNDIIFVRVTFVTLLTAMIAGWGVIYRMQKEGTIFDKQFPGCGKENYDLAFDMFGDGKCYGGPFNVLDCQYEDGDCASFNTEFPSCNGNDLKFLHDVENQVGNGKCNMTFAIPQCEYDGGDCCPYDIQLSPSFGDGQCNGGAFNTEGCWYDYEDCKVFNDLHSDCPNDLLVKSTGNVTLGNGICEGGGYDVEECGFEFGDCGKAQIGQDILLNGVLSPSSNIIDLNMIMSSDGSKVLVDMFRTDKVGKYDRTSNGTIARYFYNATSLKWEREQIIEKDEIRKDRDEYLGAATAINGNGSVIAFGSPRYDALNGGVEIYSFSDTVPTQIITGTQQSSGFGYRLDLTEDGLRIAISSPLYSGNEGLTYAGMIQIFQRSHIHQEGWTQLGDAINGTKSYDLIGLKNLHINSFDGKRVFFNARLEGPPQIRDELRVHQFDELSQQWLRMESVPESIKDSKDKKIISLTFSADGNRFAVSYYSALKSIASTEIRIYEWSEGIWKQVGPAILSQDNEFGPSISLNGDGTLLAASTANPSCTGAIAYGNASPELCATGNLQLYQYNPTNPPHRPFSPLPINSRGNTDRKHLLEDGIILGLQVALSTDGSTLTVSGYNLKQDFGFVKAYNVTELFYIDCFVEKPEWIGNGICVEYEPYYRDVCGYDGGDCPNPTRADKYEDCYVPDPAYLGNKFCYVHGSLPFGSEQCEFDGGDCPEPSPVPGYPNCLVSFPKKIADGECLDSLPYNSHDCGFDGGDCLPPEFAPTSSFQ